MDPWEGGFDQFLFHVSQLGTWIIMGAMCRNTLCIWSSTRRRRLGGTLHFTGSLPGIDAKSCFASFDVANLASKLALETVAHQRQYRRCRSSASVCKCAPGNRGPTSLHRQ